MEMSSTECPQDLEHVKTQNFSDVKIDDKTLGE